ncbi:hypothetical protein [Virgibacillus oceani]|uniref:Phage gp6-like head-tail connector protein n=1 Tax=Virgibacillus oceani TaxID=1479511 RepID=A0A917H1V0_9BACI|nr:hypothetical protein [Virgibacillus oceani]GGG64738.1 hypothetical protein GCM10011398_05450 [Virgibacillus oceani]
MALTDEQLNGLRDELKSYLHITWNDEDKDLLKYVKDGIDYLDETAGTDVDYTTDSKARRLLMDYGRYVYNHSLELFEINFERELFKFSLREGLKSFETQNTETST